MIVLQFPSQKPRVRQGSAREEVFCPVRRRWVWLTPEEWVRQNLLLYLHHVAGYPMARIAVEKQIRVGDLNRRFDILVMGPDLKPHLVVECKEMGVPLTPGVLEQALRYNIPLRAGYVIITNGIHCAGFELSSTPPRNLTDFPCNEEPTAGVGS